MAKELLESLKKRHVGEEKVQQAQLQSLMIRFNTLQMKDDDTVDAFTAKLNGYATKAKELGKTLDESLLVRKLLDSTPDRFIQIVASIEQTSDPDDITLDEITGKLKAFEERIKLQKGGQVESQDNLLFAQGDASMWYLDNGASNHMTGVKSHFKDIDESVSRRVRFGDVSYVQIKGRGSVLLGHLNFDDINKMSRKNLVEGIPRINHAGQICDACLLGKPSRTPFLNQAKFRSKNPLDLVYGDLYGPKSPATHSSKKLIFLLVDDCTRFMWGYFLTSKDQAFSTFKQFRQQIEIEMRMKLRMLRIDRGVVERRNRTVLSTMRSMMKAMKLPLTFWAEAVRHAIYILNRVPTRPLIDKTPYEALYNRKPNLENLRIFGCTAYVKITIPHLKKLDDRSIPLIYLGVEEGSKACRLYDPIAKKKHVSRDVKFMETKPWDWNKDGEDTSTQDTFREPNPINDPNLAITPPTYTYNPRSEEEEEATTSSAKNSRNIFDDTPVRGFKDLNEIYENTQEVEIRNLLLIEEEPRNYKEASIDKKWIKAMEIELESIKKNNTWTLTTLPPEQKAIGLKWVYKTKRDAEGKIIKYKARLVAKGYVQEQGIDIDEVFATVARIETIQLILALAAYHGWQVYHLDVKSAFLHGELKE
nr:zinc finger, CCHC-type [Tanacetum cinerariifolium]